ncbi:TMEM175 family protein [Leifsonia poae]|uniref:TMEM175 family protein n=1 Tax=Leifsonia poae TaxID=110933 RepID=UPI003D67CD70
MMSKARFEAFSDGVLAVAITLLVLDLHVDISPGHSLAEALADQWPSFVAYALSFLVIGVIWVNHHSILRFATVIDRVLLFENLFLLMVVTTIPFTTATLADALAHGTGEDIRIGALLYGASMTGMAVAFTLLFARISATRLASGSITRAQRRSAVLRFGAGTILYPLTAVIGIWSAPIMLAAYGALSIYYLFNQTGYSESASETIS